MALDDELTQGHSHPVFRKTCQRENLPGHAHFLTFSCFRSQPFLSRDRSRQWLVEAILLAQERHRFDVWSYVIMPEHVHLILFPRNESYSISAILSTIKQSVSKRAVLFVQQHAPDFSRHMLDQQPNGQAAMRFWQRGGGYDRNLHTHQEVWEKIAYVHHNPVRRGLVQLPQQWPWSSAADYAGTGKGPIPINGELLPR